MLKGAAQAFLPILTPIILLGGIWSGQFTPTESAAVAVAYALVLCVVVYKELHPRDLGRMFIDTARETAAIGIIICAANFFGWLLLRTGLTNKVAAAITQTTTDPIILLILLNLFRCTGARLMQGGRDLPKGADIGVTHELIGHARGIAAADLAKRPTHRRIAEALNSRWWGFPGRGCR